MLVAVDWDGSITRFFDELFEWLPALVAALLVLIVGYFLSKLVAGLVARLAARVGFDRVLHSHQAGDWIRRAVPNPSRLLGTIVFWLLMIATISIAVDVLGVDALEDAVRAVWGYIPNVLAALLIFVIAAVLAAVIGGLVRRTMGETTTGRVIGAVVPVLIMGIAVFMILDQLKIAPDIVVITYASLMGAVALGMALAFGLGGREVAAEMLRGAYIRGQANMEQVKSDLATGRERARQEAERLRPDTSESPEPPRSEDDII